MDVNSLGIIKLVKSRLHFLNARQVVLAENVANASTPGYTPRDLPTDSFAKLLSGNTSQAPNVGVRMTRSGHMDGTLKMSQSLPVKAREIPDTETTLNGNSVVLEEQTLKVAKTRMDYDAAIGVYQKTIMMLKLAARKP